MVSAVLFVEAAYILFATNSLNRNRINRRMALSEKKVSQKEILVQLRKERGLDAEGKFVLSWPG